MKKGRTTLIVALFLASFLIVPGVGMFTIGNSQDALDNTEIINEIATAELPNDREFRVALYNETNTTSPDYAFGSMNGNYSIIHPLLVNAGFDVNILTAQDILEHELTTANYDVLVLADNCPRENIANLVKDFWLGGGGILSLDSAISYLGYYGILFRETEGVNTGVGTYWTYNFNGNGTIVTRHPVTQSYVNGTEQTFIYADWAQVDLAGLATSSVWYQTTVLAVDPDNSDWGVAIAVDAYDKGGKVVQIGIPVSILPSDWNNMIIDAIGWLAPRPKARIAFDLSHQPRRSMDAWDGGSYPDSYTDIRDRWVANRYTVDKIHPSAAGNLTLATLNQYDVLMIVLPDYNFTNQEVSDLIDWVDGGGSLLLLGEAGTSIFNKGNEQLNRILNPMSMQINLELSAIGTILSELNTNHPTSEGASNGVSIGYRGYVNTTGDAFSICYTDEDIWIAGNTYGNGRVIVQADMNWITDDSLGDGENTQFGLNIVQWLSADEARILVYSDDPYDGGAYRSSVAQVLNQMEIPFYMTITDEGFDASVNGTWFSQESWDLVILDHCNYFYPKMYDGLLDYLKTGGRALVNTYFVGYIPDHAIWNYMGANYSTGWPSDASANIWDTSHQIFNSPIEYSATTMDVEDAAFGDDGDQLIVFDNATALAGLTSTDGPGNASIVLRNDGKTLLNSFLLNNMRGDTDDSAYLDTFELWFNQILFMLRPLIESPADIEYTVGETGNVIGWNCTSSYPDTVKVERDGTEVLSEAWTGDDVEISVDGLDVGTYNYTLTLTDSLGNEVTDIVVVTVVDTGFPIDTNTLIIIIIIIAALVIIIIIIRKRRK